MDALKPDAAVPLIRGEVGEIDRMNIVTTKPAPVLASFDEKKYRQQRSARELAVAYALQQPQGLGFLFPGLRPKSQR